MMYYLVDPDVLREKGIESFERMPDGRAIIDGGTLKVLGRVRVEVLPTAFDVNEMKKSQELAMKEVKK